MYQIGNFSECSTRERMSFAGKDAETQAEKFLFQNHYQFQRYGLEAGNTTVSEAMKLPATIRMKPDYLVKQLGNYSFVEAKGCGSFGLKIKLSSIEAMREWQKKAPVLMFIWHGSTKQFAFLTLGKLMELCHGLPVSIFENDGREYYQVPCSYFNWQSL